MDLFINQLLSSAATILVMLLLPFFWWLVNARKKQNFFSWIGLKQIQAEKKTTLLLWFFGAAAAFGLTSLLLPWITKGTEAALATARFSGLGWSALPAVAVYAVFSTAFWEECLFRGFLLKRLAHRFGFPAGNAVQAATFGLMHGVMFFASVGVLRAILVTLLTGMIGWGLGYLNEKQAGSSILPSWAIHALSNLIAGMYAAFAVL